METYSALFFDFDGVLADSVEVKTRAFAKLFEHHGKKIESKVVDHHRNHGGMTRREKFHYYYREFLRQPHGESDMDALCRRFSDLVVSEVIAAPEIPGAKDFLKQWHTRIPCFIVSATPDDEILEIVKQRRLAPYFREVLGSGQSKQSNLEYLLRKYDLQAEKCLFLGDAESDFKAASACNVEFLGIVPGPEAPLLQIVPDIKWVKNFIDFTL